MAIEATAKEQIEEFKWDFIRISWQVGGIPPLKNMKVSWDDEIPNIWKNKKCSKPPHVSGHGLLWPDEIEAAKMMGISGSKNGSITNLMVVEWGFFMGCFMMLKGGAPQFCVFLS